MRVAKNTGINWEKDASSPTATALGAFAEAGADVLYILTGNRTTDPDFAEAGSDLYRFLTGAQGLQGTVDERISYIRRELLEPSLRPIAGENEEQAEKRVLKEHADSLRFILLFEKPILTSGQREEVEQLLAMATNPAALSLYRSGEFAQMRAKRRDIKARIVEWLGSSYQPADAVANLLATLAIEYGVPVKLLVELVEELHEDVAVQASDADS